MLQKRVQNDKLKEINSFIKTEDNLMSFEKQIKTKRKLLSPFQIAFKEKDVKIEEIFLFKIKNRGKRKVVVPSAVVLCST